MDLPQALLPVRSPAPADADPGAADSDLLHEAFRLAAELAHDLRSPVTAIHALAEGLQEGAAGPVNTLQQRQLGLIRGAASYLCLIATDIEELARGRRRLPHGPPRPLSIRALCDEIGKLVAPLQEAKAVAVRFHTPAPDTDRRLGYANALSRVLLNLTMNALHATDRGAVTVTARPCDHRRVEFSVRDTGPGFNLRTASAGLGLTICRELLGALGSTLEITSHPAVGTWARFTVDLPPAPRGAGRE